MDKEILYSLIKLQQEYIQLITNMYHAFDVDIDRLQFVEEMINEIREIYNL